MKKQILLTAAFFAFGIVSNAQTLPSGVKNYLKKNYPDWETTKGCFAESKSFVSGDFNGDGKLDYAIAINKDNRDYTLALIAAGKSYKAHDLRGITHDESGQAAANLGVYRKGETVSGNEDTQSKSFRLKTDAISIADCDAYSEVFYWDKGKFSKTAVQ
jgi:hypothetical protein